MGVEDDAGKDGENKNVVTHPCVLMKERETRMVFSYLLPGRGANFEWPMKPLRSDIEAMRLKDLPVIFKEDQEKAITTFINELKKEYSMAGEERSHRCTKQTHGVAERGVQSVEDMVRVMRISLEERIGGRIPIGHHIMAWLVPHCADLLNKLEVGHDGRTAYERLRCKQNKGELVEFGRKVLYRINRKTRGGDMRARWDIGIWLGKDWKSGEHVVFDVESKEMNRANTVQCLPERESWDIGSMNLLSEVPSGSVGQPDSEAA